VRDAHWFRLHAYFDLATHRERVVFTYARDATAQPLLRVQGESLLDRFPLRDRRAYERWGDAVGRIAARGAGCALFIAHDDPCTVAGETAAAVVGADTDLAWLLAQHVEGGTAQVLIDAAEAGREDVALGAALQRHGVTTDGWMF
jgi:hypothetical protein